MPKRSFLTAIGIRKLMRSVLSEDRSIRNGPWTPQSWLSILVRSIAFWALFLHIMIKANLPHPLRHWIRYPNLKTRYKRGMELLRGQHEGYIQRLGYAARQLTRFSLLDRAIGLLGKTFFWLLHVYSLLANGGFVCTAYYLYAEV